MKKIIFLSLLIGTSAGAEIQSETRYASATPVIDTSIYAAKDSIGGIMTFSNITCANNKRGRITSVVLSDKSDNAVEYDILTFKTPPAGTFTDQAASDPADADLLIMNPVINLATTDHFSFNDNGVSSLSTLGSNAISASTGSTPGNLYANIVSRGTPTYATAGDLTLTIGWTCP
jgi:hypothetical protein